jgi:hypothetical protein
MSVRVVKDRMDPPEVTDAHGQDLPQGSLALMLEATAHQHRAVMELQALFARKGGELSRHFLTPANVKEEMFQLEDLKSFTIVNFSTVTVYLGMGGASSTAGNAFPIPPLSFMQFPIETNVAKIGAALTDLESVGSAEVAFIRFRHLVNFAAGNLSAASAGASSSGVSAVTSKSPRSVAVGVASAAVIAANPERRGLSIENTSETPVSLGLGQPAVVGDDVVLQPAGSWDGTISGVLWRGAVNAIATAVSSLAVVEI